MGPRPFIKKQLAEVTNVVGRHPEILQDEKKAANQSSTKTEKDALRSTSNGQFYSPEKKLSDDVIPHGVAFGPPGTKGSNSHRSQSWKEAKKSAKNQAAKKTGAESTVAGASPPLPKAGTSTATQAANTVSTTPNANAPNSPTSSAWPTSSQSSQGSGDPTAANQGNLLNEDFVEDCVRRSSR